MRREQDCREAFERCVSQREAEAATRKKSIDILVAARVLQASEASAFMGQWADSQRVV